jgi:diacylglycerol kinase family enzyme
MHIYIYDNFVTERKYDKVVANIETRITDLGLNGKIIRLGIATNIYNTIETEIKKGAKTIVVVGDSAIFNQAINALAKFASAGIMSRPVPLGFIPISPKNSQIAAYFGIDNYRDACDFISARRIESIGLGLANDQYFLTQVRITTSGSIIEIDKDYTIEILENGIIYVINLPTEIDLPERAVSDARDNT